MCLLGYPQAGTVIAQKRTACTVPSLSVCDQTSQQASEEPSTPLTPAQMKEVDESFAVFDYSETGTLNLHEIKVTRRT